MLPKTCEKNCLTSKRVWVSLGMCSWNCQSRADRFHLEYLAFHIFQILCFDILIFTLNLIYLKFGVFIFFSVLTCSICQYQYQHQPEFGKPCIQSKSRPDQWPVWSRILYFKYVCWILDSLCSLFGHFQPNFQKYWKVQNESLGGHMLFGIAGIVQVEKGDRRITLQCGPPPILHFVFETCLTAP